jgi:hypothetical protein
MMDSRVYIEHFEKDFYKSVYRRWRLDAEKAAKDIVGEEYESFRSTIYKQHGFSVVEDKSRKTIGGYDADLAIERDGEIIIVEEAKGHYVDSCFLQRAISSCAIVVAHCISENKEPPHFVLSCPTKMNNYSEVFDRQCALYREDIRHYLKTKFTYLPVCTHGRVGRRKYYANEENCFTLNEELVQQQLSFLEGIKND